jgi:hypothetical protein
VRSILSVTSVAAALGAAATFAQSASAAPPERNPSLSALSSYVAFKSTSFTRAKTALDIPDNWPFSLAGSTTGESVRIHLSKTVFTTPDTTTAQHWADFFDSLVHGSELTTLDAYFLTLREVQAICGRGALACYGDNEMFAPAEDPAIDLSTESVVAHEYGHHMAAHRLNPPWEAVDYGTKRWASYMNVCAKTRRDQWFPGAEDTNKYFYNPGEGLAEAFRVLNEQRLGLQESPWDIVSDDFMPDAQALVLLEQDVTDPWTKNTTLARSGSVSARAKSRAFVVSTPLDGRMSVRLTSSAKAKFRLDVLSPNAKSIGHASGRNVTASATVCGERALRLRVNRVTGAGAFRLTISRP